MASAVEGDVVWIQADLGISRFIQGVATAPVHRAEHVYVKRYSLQCGLNGRIFRDFRNVLTQDALVLEGKDKNTFYRLYPHYCRFVRLVPLTWSTAVGLRWDVYGCKSKTLIKMEKH